MAAIQLGAVDFIQKPFEDQSLQARIEQLCRMWGLEQENRRLKEQMQVSISDSSHWSAIPSPCWM